MGGLDAPHFQFFDSVDPKMPVARIGAERRSRTSVFNVRRCCSTVELSRQCG